jgi:hypothetical protein
VAPGCIYWSLPRGEVPSDAGAWGREKVQERESQISLSLLLPLPPPGGVTPYSLCPEPRDVLVAACRAARASGVWGVQPLSKQEVWSLGHSQGDRL